MDTSYTAIATSTGDGRNGRARTSDGVLDLELATPKELGGAGGATNPEQLFAAGYAACFHSALKAVARAEKAAVSDTAVTAEVGLGKDEQGSFGLAVALHVELSGLEQGAAEALVAKAHQMCPYSAAIRGNVEVALETVVA